MRIQKRYFGYTYATLSDYHEGIHDYPEHIHQFLEVLCVLEGEIQVTVNGKTELARKGDIAIVPPFQAHGQHTPNYCKIWVGLISPPWITDFFSWDNFYTADRTVFTPTPSTFAYIIGKLPPAHWIKSVSSLTDEFSRKTKALYYAILEEYFICVKINKSNLNTTALSATYMYVYEHYRESITLKKVAAAIGYTSNYISYCLSVIPNANFRTILNSARIDHAKKLLVNTDMRIVDIALDSGFASENVFYGIFEKHTGMTPRTYRLAKRNS